MKTISRFIATLTGLLLLGSAYSGLVNPHIWAFPAATGLAFPFLAFLALLLMLVMALLRQWRALLVLMVFVALSWPVLKLYMPLHGPKEVPTGATTFRLMTYNVYGFDGDGATMRYILNQDADFVLLQEASWGEIDFTDLPCHVDMREEIEQKFPFHSHGYHDLIILSKIPYTVLGDTLLRQDSYSPSGESTGYHYYAKVFDVRVAGEPLRIVNVHLQSIGLSNSDKEVYRKLTKTQFEGREQLSHVHSSIMSKLRGAYKRRANEALQLRKLLDDSIQAPNVIVCGDFNDTPGSYCYRTVRGDDLRDAFAECGRWPTFTFNRDRFYFKIDHIFYRGALQALAMRRDRAGQSDHYPQVATFALGEPKQTTNNPK